MRVVERVILVLMVLAWMFGVFVLLALLVAGLMEAIWGT